MVKETWKIAVTSFKILHGKWQLLLSTSWLAAIFLHIVQEITNKEIYLSNFLYDFYSSQRNYIALKPLFLDQTLFAAFFYSPISTNWTIKIFCCCLLSAMIYLFCSPLYTLCVCIACSAFPVIKLPDCCQTNCFIHLGNSSHFSAFTHLLTEGRVATYFT